MADGTEVGAEIERVAGLFRQVLRQQRRASSRDWMTVELTMAQMKVLFVLHHDGPAGVTELAETLGVAPPSMTGTLDRLVRAELVERGADASDRRRVITTLTPAGAALVERLQQGRRARLLAALVELDGAALADLERGLAALLVALEATGPEAEGSAQAEPVAGKPAGELAAALARAGR